jgi:hypothetical protein
MHFRAIGLAALAAVSVTVADASHAGASTIVAGFNANTLPRNDDGSTGSVAIGFTLNFFGVNRSSLFVNNNGNVTLDSALSTFTPFNLTSTGRQIIAPFFADVDTRNVATSPVTYGTGTFLGRDTFGVNWLDVGYFSSGADKLNSFQLLLVDRTDTGAGNADIYFNYGKIQWETGGASGGSGGLGGSSARAGFSNGTAAPGTSFEIAGSAVNGAFLDGGPNALVDGSNVGEPGRFIFQVRNGTIVQPPTGVPAPAALALFGVGLLALGALRRRA